ncbi:hypothetical protein [Cohnella cellulosilytica]|uniref:hypothetical protein n=1 Tax=Cohnella cellulosilytica TaxID=986710 RepID=UPI0035EA5BDD
MKNRISVIPNAKKKIGLVVLCVALACILTVGVVIAGTDAPQQSARPGVAITASESDNDSITEVTHFLELLRRSAFSDRPNANAPANSIQPQAVVAPANSERDTDNEVVRFLEMLQQQGNVEHQAE